MALCECGCGQQTKIAWRSNSRYGHVKGIPLRFISGHNSRVRVQSVEERQKKSTSMTGKRLGERHPRWRGGRVLSGGYIRLTIGRDHPMADKTGTVFEHRLVMAEHLGRMLTVEEVVHHINGVRDDNRIENLMLFPDQASHLAWHRMLEHDHELRISMPAVQTT